MKKKVLIGLIIFFIVAGGVLFFLYKYTNLLLTKKQIFWKYAVKNCDIVNLFNSDDMKEFRKNKANNSYKQMSTIKVSADNDLYKITAETNAKSSNEMYTYALLEKNSEKIIDAKGVKKSNFVGVKVDEVLNGYVVVKNNNLKDLAKKMGIGDVELIPDNINSCNYLELLEISEDDAKYISKKYANLIMSKTSNSNYEKLDNTTIKIDDKSYDVEVYRFTLTENEMKELSSAFCKTLSEDSRTLNLLSTKLKLMNVPSKYTSINYLSDKCGEIANRINSMDTTNDEFIQITVYIQGQELIQTNIKFENENLIKIIYNKDENSLSIQQDRLNVSNKFILSVSDVLDYALSKVKSINIKTEVLDNNSKVLTHANIVCENDINIAYEAETVITDDITISDEYENSSKIILNDLSEEQLQYVFKAVSAKVKEIYQEKVKKITNSNTDTTSVEQAEQPNAETEENQENVME